MNINGFVLEAEGFYHPFKLILVQFWNDVERHQKQYLLGIFNDTWQIGQNVQELIFCKFCENSEKAYQEQPMHPEQPQIVFCLFNISIAYVIANESWSCHAHSFSELVGEHHDIHQQYLRILGCLAEISRCEYHDLEGPPVHAGHHGRWYGDPEILVDAVE